MLGARRESIPHPSPVPLDPKAQHRRLPAYILYASQLPGMHSLRFGAHKLMPAAASSAVTRPSPRFRPARARIGPSSATQTHLSRGTYIRFAKFTANRNASSQNVPTEALTDLIQAYGFHGAHTFSCSLAGASS